MSIIAKAFDLIRETWRGKSIGRILSNWAIGERCKNLEGALVDLASGDQASYERYWNMKRGHLTRVDIDSAKRPDVVVDINKSLPFADASADHVFLFSALYIVQDPPKLFAEVRRILKHGGKFWIMSPFLFPEAKEPSDLRRYTSEGLTALFADAGFREVVIEPFGERCTVAASLISPLIPFRIVRIPLFALALLLDRCVPSALRQSHPAPFGYLCVGEK